MQRLRLLAIGAAIGAGASPALAGAPAQAAPAKPAYVWGRAFHILPQTHSDESGYFSLCEGLDGSIYIGTARYGRNCYLVEFDPRTERQRIVVDVHKLCGLNDAGYAAQAKVHTRNFVGPSGKVYFGSKQGYRLNKDDTAEYPGGYLMTYDPRSGQGANLGMPYKGQGVIDVAADEDRGLIYVVTCEDQHWMLYDAKARAFRELGPMLTPYASTLIDRAGRAAAITKDFELAQYDPAAGKVTVRPILVDGRRFARADDNAIPTWVLAADRGKAYLILMNDPTLIEIDLLSAGEAVQAVGRGRMIEGRNPDSRCALSLSPDGRLYAVVAVDNQTGFGGGRLHHLARFDPARGRMEDLGVLAVKNPGFFNFAGTGGTRGKKPPWSHGYHTLPDGTLTPLHHHMAMAAASDGTIYVTIICPFTLLRIDAFRRPESPPSPAGAYIRRALDFCDAAEQRMPEFTRIAEVAADRHIAGGLLGFPWNGQTLQAELMGRSGGLVHTGFERPFKKDRTDAERASDVAVVGWDRAPGSGERQALEALRKRGAYIIAFGPKNMPEVERLLPLCDAFFDTGMGADDRVVDLPGGLPAGVPGRRVARANHLVNALQGWVFTGELVAALTRRGRMPTIWKAYAYEDGPAWGQKYLGVKQFHDEYAVPPIPAGQLGRAYIERIRYLLRRLGRMEMPAIRRAGELIAEEMKQGRKTIVASTGHMASYFIGKGDDVAWAVNVETHHNVPSQLEAFARAAPQGALVLRLGYAGEHRDVLALLREKKARIILITAENPRPEFQVTGEFAVRIDMGYAFGDACVGVEGYPLLLLPPSGVMQVAVYESINAEALSRLPPPTGP